MGRPKAEFVNLDIEKRRNYRLNRYYSTKNQLVNAQAAALAIAINQQLELDLSSEKLRLLQELLLEHCKFKISPTKPQS